MHSIVTLITSQVKINSSLTWWHRSDATLETLVVAEDDHRPKPDQWGEEADGHENVALLGRLLRRVCHNEGQGTHQHGAKHQGKKSEELHYSTPMS